MEQEYGIKYRVIKLDKEKFLLFPVSLEKGILTDDGFQTRNRIFPFANKKESLESRYVVDMIFGKEELSFIYDFENDDDFLMEYFFEDFKDTVFFIETDSTNDYLLKNEINLRLVGLGERDASFYMDKSIPAVVLNEKSIGELLDADDLAEVRLLLLKYKRFMNSFSSIYKEKGITKVHFVDGKVDFLETNRKIDDEQEFSFKKMESSVSSFSNHDVSYQGLREYLKERIFGHDEELDIIAQKLYMNYTAQSGEDMESILLVGPTGTGKTETIHAACRYLDIPTFEANASNIVPQGIKGMSIEDVICGLYEKAGEDLEKAQRGLIFLDEFDKLNDSDLDLKTSVKNILLTFTAGGVFPIDNDRYSFSFDSSMTNKVYAGVFERISMRDKYLGFHANSQEMDVLGNEDEIRQKILDKKYFSLEELSRISTVLGYKDLDRDTKKNILLYSKLSELFKKKERYFRQFGVELIAQDDYIEALLDSLDSRSNGMRSVNNLIKRNLNGVEKYLLENEETACKKLILSRNTVENQMNFEVF